jgi:hypothetical protein
VAQTAPENGSGRPEVAKAAAEGREGEVMGKITKEVVYDAGELSHELVAGLEALCMWMKNERKDEPGVIVTDSIIRVPVVNAFDIFLNADFLAMFSDRVRNAENEAKMLLAQAITHKCEYITIRK